MRVTGIVLAGLSATAVAVSAPPTRALESGPMSRCIAGEARKLGFHGVAAVRRPSGESDFAAGEIDQGSGATIDLDTRFNLASAGKMFTAVAIAQLVDAGKVSLEDPIGGFVSGLSPTVAAVSVRQLLTHSSGLGNYFTPEHLGDVAKARSASDLLPLVAGESLAFAPGARFDYSNSGFVLLGVLIEQVSGERYDAYLARHVFAPAGMTASGMDPDAPGHRAVGMTALPAMLLGGSGGGAGPSRQRILPRPDGPAPPAGPLRPAREAALWGGPAGGGYSTANDMERFFAALAAGRLTSARMLATLTSRQIVAAPATATMPEHDYGLGFGVGLLEGHRWYGHNGGAPGVTTEFAAFPGEGVTIAVLSDRDPPTASLLFRAIRALALHPRACAA